MRSILLLVALCVSTLAMAEKPTVPDWMDPMRREAFYPVEKYYTGFASVTVTNGEDKAAIYERVQQNARVAAISSIQVSVEQTVERYIKNTQAKDSATTLDIMTSYAQSHTGIKEIPGLKVEVWENPKTGDISAFAWVNIYDLSKRLTRRIIANVAKTDVELQAIESLVQRGDKIQAINELSNLQTMLDNIENDQRIMLSIDPTITDEDLAIEDYSRLKERCLTLTSELKNGINIYLVCDAMLFGTNYHTLKGELQSELSKMGCAFNSGNENSDWAIYITAIAREYNMVEMGGMKQYYVYVDANIIVEKTATGQRIYENSISEKGSHTLNYEQAARQAYHAISPKISNILNEQIKR